VGSHRRLAPSGPNRGRGLTVTVLTAATAAAAALGATSAGAAPQDRPAGTRAEVDRLYRQAEQATEAYNKAGEHTDTLRGVISRAQDRIARESTGWDTRRRRAAADRLGPSATSTR